MSTILDLINCLVNQFVLVFIGKIIGILGYSFVYWAEQRATERVYTRNLAMNKKLIRVCWLGIKGQRWEGLLGQLLVVDVHFPDVLIIYLGVNGVGKLGMLNHVQMKISLIKIFQLFLEFMIIYTKLFQGYCD